MATSDREARRSAARSEAAAKQFAAQKRADVITDVKARRRGATHEERKTYVRRETGLEVLRRLKLLSEAEMTAGERYAELYRMVTLESAAVIPSFLESPAFKGAGQMTNGSKSGSGESNGQIDYQAAEARQRASTQLAWARNSMDFAHELIFACDMICGLGKTPREVLPDQRKAAELTTTLQIALRLLMRHFAETKSQAS